MPSPFATISRCVKAARRAFDNDGDAQSYMRNVRGRSFEFTAAVATVNDDPAPDAGARVASASPSS